VTPALFSNVRSGGQDFPNRIAVAPMGQNRARSGIVQPWHLQHLGCLAVTDPGVLIMEASSVQPEGAGTVGAVSLYTDAQEAALKNLVESIRTFSDTKIGMQIFHCGRKVDKREWEGIREELDIASPDVFAPSPIAFSDNHPMPVELDSANMKRIKAGFVEAAQRAARAGMDLLEIHAAHGFLLHQFYSHLTNLRTDEYGGTFEKRMRYPLEVAEAIRAVWPKSRTLGVRLNCLDYVSGDRTIDEAVILGKQLASIGVDYICCSSGSIVSRVQTSPTTPGYLVQVAERMRKETGIPVMVVGHIVDPRQAEKIIACGQADMIGVARGFIDDPRWMWHAAEKLGVEVKYPPSYERAHHSRWLGAGWLRSAEPLSFD